jgi:hypothetical protein
MCAAADKIKTNLMVSGVNQKHLANYLAISEKTLSYQLNNSRQLRDDIKEGAQKFFMIQGIELILDDSKECAALLKAAGHLLNNKTSEMNLEQFYDEVLQAISDNVLTEREKCKLITVVERLRLASKKQNEERMAKVERSMDNIVNLLNHGMIFNEINN